MGGGARVQWGRSATRVKDCSRAPAPTVILSLRGPGRRLGVDKFSRGDDDRTGRRRRDEDGVRHLEVD